MVLHDVCGSEQESARQTTCTRCLVPRDVTWLTVESSFLARSEHRTKPLVQLLLVIVSFVMCLFLVVHRRGQHFLSSSSGLNIGRHRACLSLYFTGRASSAADIRSAFATHVICLVARAFIVLPPSVAHHVRRRVNPLAFFQRRWWPTATNVKKV